MDHVCIKDFLKEYSSGKVGFVRYALADVENSRLVLVQSNRGPAGFSFGLFILPNKTSIICSYIAEAFKGRKLRHFYFNKVCSCKILTCVRREAFTRYFLLGLATHYHES